ncbi:glutaredoxin family protein [Arthrobacter koreensis]|uniref:glutaredoxin family protein n=1 Tax=Arthrobacter koreensis TaxID=199136 RepID=UPI001264C65A|nr:glutaredoxin family protein [Arthrobacter koreensis]
MTITVYTKPGCSPCKLTIGKFKTAGLDPQVVDISVTPAALEYITEELGYAQAPVVVYERDGSEDHWSGLNPDKINQVIALETPTPNP